MSLGTERGCRCRRRGARRVIHRDRPTKLASSATQASLAADSKIREYALPRSRTSVLPPPAAARRIEGKRRDWKAYRERLASRWPLFSKHRHDRAGTSSTPAAFVDRLRSERNSAYGPSPPGRSPAPPGLPSSESTPTVGSAWNDPGNAQITAFPPPLSLHCHRPQQRAGPR